MANSIAGRFLGTAACHWAIASSCAYSGGETLASDEQYERVTKPDGSTKLVRKDTIWEPIVGYEKMERDQ